MGDAFGSFFLPGPTEVRAEVLHAMTGAMMPHRGQAFEELFARLQHGLRAVFRTMRPVFLSSSSATGLMEAGIRCAPPGPMLAIVNGAFSERFEQIGRSCLRDVEVLRAEWGSNVALEIVEQRLASRQFAIMTLVHSETSTGALADVRGLNALARRYGALALVDSVTGIGGAPLEFDAWEMDYVLTGSQKAIALPPGLAFAVASPRYMASASHAPDRGLYFDLVEFEQYAARNQTPNTPAISLLYALDVQLRHILAEGVEQRWARHEQMRTTVEDWVHATGQELLASHGHRSPTVSAIKVPSGVAAATIVRMVAEQGFTIGTGYGPLRDSTYRIGHMGDHTVPGVVRCLTVCEAALNKLANGAAARTR